VTLEDLYCGASKKLRLTKNVICTECAGKGGKGAGAQQCKSCRGQGVKIVIRQIGPGMIQQMQTYCSDCNGEGTVIADADKCPTCAGARTTKEKKTLEVFINKGMKNGERIIFAGEADEAPDTTPGDVVVVLQMKEHEEFKREAAHLIMKKTISLAESLCGFEFKLKHLDGRILVVKSEPGIVTKPGDFKAIMNEGMPHPKSIFQKGNLYIEFNVEFPKSGMLPENTLKLIKKILPASEHKDDDIIVPPEHDECTLTDVDMEAERRKFAEQQHREAYDEDEEHEHHHAGPTCRQA
jgi:DnaJ family protein A protein 2